METKFHLLPVGQHFEWEGKNYVKTTPLIADQVPDGGQKFMPRAALVTISGTEMTPAAAAKPTSLDSAIVREAITRHHQRCVEIILSSCGPQQAEPTGDVTCGLEQLYRELLEELNL